MNIYFDYQIFYLQKAGGISKYFIELATALREDFASNVQIVNPFFTNLQNEAHRKSYPDLYSRLTFGGTFAKSSLERQIAVTEWITRRKCSRKGSILHETYYTNRIGVKSPKVVTVHDMIYEMFSGGSQGEKEVICRKRDAIEEAAAVIAVSDNTRTELLKHYPHISHKVHTVHHGVAPVLPDEVQEYQHHRPFILFVGNRGWYKNFDTLLEIYTADPVLRNEYDIICCGGGNATEDELRILKKNSISDRVYFLKGNDAFVDSLYKSAACLAYISRHEGFGLPVLEAMRFGCPVLCSNSSSLPEVAGDAAIQVDVKDQQAVTAGLHRVLEDQDTRKRLRKAGPLRAAQFTWKKCAGETLKIYETVL